MSVLTGAPLTTTQLETRDFIQSFNTEKGFCPTIREIGDHFEISLRASFARLHQLERHGTIALIRLPSSGRAIRAITVLPWSQA